MVYVIDKRDYPCSGECQYNNVEASVVYDNVRNGYYILVAPQKLENKGSYTMVTTIPTDCNRYLLREVNRRTKKRDAEANKDFIALVSTLVSVKFKQFNLILL